MSIVLKKYFWFFFRKYLPLINNLTPSINILWCVIHTDTSVLHTQLLITLQKAYIIYKMVRPRLQNAAFLSIIYNYVAREKGEKNRCKLYSDSFSVDNAFCTERSYSQLRSVPNIRISFCVWVAVRSFDVNKSDFVSPSRLLRVAAIGGQDDALRTFRKLTCGDS